MTYAPNLPAPNLAAPHLRIARLPAVLRPLPSRLAISLQVALRGMHERGRLRRAARDMLALPDATLRDIGVSRWEIVAAIRLGRSVPRRGR
ncbi:MAG: hypothetical protein RIB84_12580 [Sneathiellaceae bacterium]